MKTDSNPRIQTVSQFAIPRVASELARRSIAIYHPEF